MIVDPIFLSLVGTVAAISFVANSAMRWATRIPTAVIILYQAVIYLYIGLGNPPILEKMLFVRIGTLVFFLNILIGDLVWIVYLSKHRITYGKRKDDIKVDPK